MVRDKKIRKNFLKYGVTLVFLFGALCITSFALAYKTVSVQQNRFHTGTVDINLNDGKPVIREDEFLFEPGITVKKEFFVKNEGSWDVYYKLYFDNIQGTLADVLEVSIQEDSTVLYSGTLAQLTQSKVEAVYDKLAAQSCKYLDIYFHYPENAANKGQGTVLSFDFCASAVQTKNNPNQKFD